MHSAFIGALSLVCLATWRASARDREAFRSLVESLEEGVVMIDRDGTMVAANPSATRILGMRPAEVLSGYGHAEWSFVDADGAAAADARDPAADHGDDRRSAGVVPLGLRRPRGETRWLAVSTRAVETDRDGPYTIVVSFTDVTEEREAAEALERSNAELPVRLHRLARPVRAAADGVELPRAAAPPLPRAGWTRTRTSSSSTPSTAPRACGR